MSDWRLTLMTDWVPDPKYAEELCAWIVPKRGAVLGAEVCDARR